MVVPPYLANQISKDSYASCIGVVRSALYGYCLEANNFKDLYQEAWLIVLKNWIEQKPITLDRCRYLAQTAKNLCINMMRKRHLLSEEEAEDALNRLTTESYQPNALLEHYSEVFDNIREKYGLNKLEDPLAIDPEDPRLLAFKAELQSIPDKEWRALWLKYYCNYSYKEIASVLDLEESSVDQLLHRSKKRLKASISLYN